MRRRERQGCDEQCGKVDSQFWRKAALLWNIWDGQRGEKLLAGRKEKSLGSIGTHEEVELRLQVSSAASSSSFWIFYDACV